MIKKLFYIIGVVFLVGCQSIPGQGITQQQASAILNELREIKTLLKQPARGAKVDKTPSIVTTTLNKRPQIGRDSAPITLVEFTDYQCPYCSRFNKTTMQQLKKKYVSTGKLKVLVKDLPLYFHKEAKVAAKAAQCANEQGKYWQYRARLFANQKKMQMPHLYAYAKKLSLNSKRFKSCMASNKYDKQIEQDIAEAKK